MGLLDHLDELESLPAGVLGAALGVGGTAAVLAVDSGLATVVGMAAVVGAGGLAVTGRLRVAAVVVGEPPVEAEAESPAEVDAPAEAFLPFEPAAMLEAEDEVGRELLGLLLPVPEGVLQSKNWKEPLEIEAFEMMKVPVTERLWREVMGESPGRWGDEAPVTEVSWFDAVDFCNAASIRAGLRPCYVRTGEDVTWDPTGDGFRMPAEAEWEWACLAGARTRFSWGDDEEGAEAYAWFAENSDGRARPVGTKRANAWGLHDMHGNVWEWCWSAYSSEATGVDSVTLVTSVCPQRVVRGGSCWFTSWDLAASIRLRDQPSNEFRVLGFRCVRGPRRQRVTLEP